MNKYLFPLYAVLIGFVIVWLSKKPGELKVKLLLAFSGAFLLSLTVFDLLPEVYEAMEPKHIGLFIMLGIFLQIFLEFFSKGAEHGHLHSHETALSFPWLLFISLCIHSFLEGFPVMQHNDMMYGILVHKIPIAILLSTFLFQAKFKPLSVFLILFIFGIMTPLGTFISNNQILDLDVINAINAVVIGIFFHISTTILFESSEGHSFNLGKMVVMILAVTIAYFI